LRARHVSLQLLGRNELSIPDRGALSARVPPVEDSSSFRRTPARGTLERPGSPLPNLRPHPSPRPEILERRPSKCHLLHPGAEMASGSDSTHRVIARRRRSARCRKLAGETSGRPRRSGHEHLSFGMNCSRGRTSSVPSVLSPASSRANRRRRMRRVDPFPPSRSDRSCAKCADSSSTAANEHRNDCSERILSRQSRHDGNSFAGLPIADHSSKECVFSWPLQAEVDAAGKVAR